VPFIIIVITTIIIKWNWFKNLFTQVKNVPTVPVENVPVENTDVKQIENKDENKNELFAINDNGNFDLMDMNGKILNIGFGPNPKVYINLLDQSEKDADKTETENGVSFISKVGDIKQYEVGGRPYIVNFTRLT
jgi:hypothetical protein